MDFLDHALRYLQAGQAAMAESMASRALAAGSDEASALSLLALARSAQSKPRDALPLYRRLTALQPEVATHWSNLGNCLCELGMEAEARDPLMRARTLGADDDAVHFALARMYSVLGPAAVGLEHIDLALERAPGDPEYRLLRAKLLYTLDEWEDANAEIRKLMAQPLDQEERSRFAN